MAPHCLEERVRALPLGWKAPYWSLLTSPALSFPPGTPSTPAFWSWLVSHHWPLHRLVPAKLPPPLTSHDPQPCPSSASNMALCDPTGLWSAFPGAGTGYRSGSQPASAAVLISLGNLLKALLWRNPEQDWEVSPPAVTSLLGTSRRAIRG